jgi:DNA-binding CsgD family transcriptional regulator
MGDSSRAVFAMLGAEQAASHAPERKRVTNQKRASTMGLHRLVEEFATKAPRCRNADELFGLMEPAARELGFPRIAMVHGLWFRLPGQRQFIRLDNFADWAEIFIDRRYYFDDPGLLASQRTNLAFLWSETRRLLPFFTRRHEMILREADRHGLRQGLTLPVGVMGEPHGCCSFATDGDLPSIWHLRAATLIGAAAFHEARRLHGFPRQGRCPPRISPRKLECLRLIACGKTDREIASILAVKIGTVHTHMAHLRQDFDAHSRAQLIAEALRFGLVSYDDILPA